MATPILVLGACGDPEEPAGSDHDGDGYTETQGDCDDGDDGVHPDADELCDGIDNDCDRGVDEPGAVDGAAYYLDDDDDGYGDPDNSTTGCWALSGYVDNRLDCDDSDAGISPAASERCDGHDDNCNDMVDESSAVDAQTWYADDDDDGYGDPDQTQRACDRPSGYTSDSRDCDDRSADAHPAGDEICDELDNDCDGWVDSSGEFDSADGTFGTPTYVAESEHFLGNVFQPTEDLLLETVSFYIQPNASTTGYFQVFEYDGFTEFDLVASDSIYLSTDSYYEWYSSDDLDIMLSAGGYYVIGFGTNGGHHYLAFEDEPHFSTEAGLRSLGWHYDFHDGTPNRLDGTYFAEYQFYMQVQVAMAAAEDQDRDLDGYSPFCGDCDDNAPDSFPEATEVCGDGIDQDCDGQDLDCDGPRDSDSGTW